MTAAYIASGLDPKKSILFNQSQVAAHAELAWIFNCVARLGWLNRMTQFKEKAGKDRENASVGLYAYPNLMAADILAYRATHVPVGEDQKQHLELARDIAQKFNNDFKIRSRRRAIADGVFFPQPEPVITGPATRVMSLRDGTKKMSKSDPSDLSRINLTDDADTIADKMQTRQDRSRAAALRAKRALPAGRRPTICRHLRGADGPGEKRAVLAEFGGSSSRPSRRRSPTLRVAQARPDRRRDPAPHRRSGRDRPRAGRRRGAGPGHRDADHERGQGYRRLHPVS